ncbi:MAG: TlpA disulfide reductase family protein, partial [Betaproteobacteria bacterium]
MTLPSACRRAALAALLLVLGAAAWAAPGVGDVPPAELGSNMDGDKVLVSGFAGKAVVLTFWATWCPYCLKELPVLENVQNKAGKERLQVIAVNTEERDVFRRASRIMRKAMTLELVSDASGRAARADGVTGLPHMVIVGRDGRIVGI